jgi:hypothetical protein
MQSQQHGTLAELFANPGSRMANIQLERQLTEYGIYKTKSLTKTMYYIMVCSFALQLPSPPLLQKSVQI